jgi:hypothetical protein
VAHGSQGVAPEEAAPLAGAPACSHAGVAALFLRGLGAVHVCFFLSLLVQVLGLVGSDGILPAADFLARVRVYARGGHLALLPTLFWIDAGDATLVGACALGAVLGLLQMLGMAPLLLLPLLWALALSLVNVGQVFLGYQWDGLLLEATLLAIPLAPPGWRPGPREPHPAALFLLRFLLFRLMVSSGLVKLLSGDPLWRGLAALRVHYETQPLPTWAGYYAHQLPPAVQTLSCLLMFAIELLVPFFAFFPRRARRLAFVPLAGLQVAIAVTGNYAFFNLLAILLCVLLLDDGVVPGATPKLPAARHPVHRAFVLAACVLLGAIGLVPFLGSFAELPWPRPLVAAYEIAAPLRSSNAYGLFAVMTPDRPEIQVEGSRDGIEWRAYAFRYKPADPARAPAFVAPHQPRLDWQMWFAALRGSCEAEPWFHRFLERLREGSADVKGLLGSDPFPEGPPRFLRARLLDYRFTTLDEKSRTGNYWRVDDKGFYCDDLPPR